MDTNQMVGAADIAHAGATMAPQATDALKAPCFVFEVACFKPGKTEPEWTERVRNLVTDVGRTDILEKYLRASGYTAAWYLVLKGSGSVAAGNTLASHAGWSEVNPYAGSNRPTVTFPAVSAGAVTSNQVSVSINAAATVAGAGIAASQAIATTSGVLYNIADFSTARTVDNGDTLQVSLTLSVTL